MPLQLSRRLYIGLLALSSLFPRLSSAQPKPSITGDYAGTLSGALHLKLHITAAPDGSLRGTLDSIDQAAIGLPCADFQIDGTSLSFRVPVVYGTWKGTVSADGTTLAGTWDQGSPLPLNFTRD